MFYNKATAVAASAAAAFVLTVAGGTSAYASIRVYVPWTDQTVFALSPTNSYVAEWMGSSSGWTIIGGPAQRIYAGSAGVFEIDENGDIEQYNGTPYSWTVIGGPGDVFAEGGGHLYGLGPDGNYVAEYNGTPGSWTIIGGPASYIWAGTDGLIAMAPYNTSEDIWYYNGTPNSWSDISAYAGGLAVGSNTIYKLSADDATVSEWNGGTSWTPILTNAGNIIDMVGGDEGLYVVEDDPSSGEYYYKYNGVAGDWSQIGEYNYIPFPEVESRTSLYGMSFDDTGSTGVDLYSGSGTTWTAIGGPAGQLAAGD